MSKVHSAPEKDWTPPNHSPGRVWTYGSGSAHMSKTQMHRKITKPCPGGLLVHHTGMKPVGQGWLWDILHQNKTR